MPSDVREVAVRTADGDRVRFGEAFDRPTLLIKVRYFG